MKTTTKLMLIAMLALAVGGTCPSDVNNDGTVGINDFLAVLADWGDCPVTVLYADANLHECGDSTVFARHWSDGHADFRVAETRGRNCHRRPMSERSWAYP